MSSFDPACPRRLAGTALAACLALAGMRSAAAAEPVFEEDGRWHYALGAGGSISSGNSSSRSANLTIDAVKASDADKLTLYGRALYSEDSGETASDQVSAGARYDRDLTPNWFHFGTLDWLRDRPANLVQRWSLNSGLGHHIFKREKEFWDVFSGLGYSRDEFVDPTLIAGRVRAGYGRAELMIGEQSQTLLTPNTTLMQRFVILPNLEDTSAFRSVFETSLSVAMNRHFALTASLTHRYNSHPGEGVGRSDLLFVTGITLRSR